MRLIQRVNPFKLPQSKTLPLPKATIQHTMPQFKTFLLPTFKNLLLPQFKTFLLPQATIQKLMPRLKTLLLPQFKTLLLPQFKCLPLPTYKTLVLPHSLILNHKKYGVMTRSGMTLSSLGTAWNSVGTRLSTELNLTMEAMLPQR